LTRLIFASVCQSSPKKGDSTVPRWSAPGEEGLIRRIRRIFPEPPPEVQVSIGDDAAVVRISDRDKVVLTTDQLVEGIHFRRATHPPGLLGSRALTVNLSDLASMGAIPRWFLLTLFLPWNLPPSYLDGILRGMAREARRRGVFLVGGNLTAAPVLSLDISLVGTLGKGRKPMLRGGARPGDRLYLTGTLGGSALGLELLGAGWRWRRGKAYLQGSPAADAAAATRALRAHLAPAPDYRLASLLSRHRLASAAIDTSDGLASDLWRLCRASSVGARVEEEYLPVDSAALHLRGTERARDLALNGGEEYQLLFAVPPSREKRLLALAGRSHLRRIGSFRPTREGVVLEEKNGKTRPLEPRGFDHLRKIPG